MKDKFKLSEFDQINYNAHDAPGFERGKSLMGKNGKCALTYSVYRIEKGIAFCQSRNVLFGDVYHEEIPIKNLKRSDGSDI